MPAAKTRPPSHGASSIGCARVDATRSGSVFREGVVRKAVEPALADFCRRDHRMVAGSRVLRGVSVWRAVAAQGAATLLACSEVHPLGAALHALCAFASRRLLHGRYRAD